MGYSYTEVTKLIGTAEVIERTQAIETTRVRRYSDHRGHISHRVYSGHRGHTDQKDYTCPRGYSGHKLYLGLK